MSSNPKVSRLPYFKSESWLLRKDFDVGNSVNTWIGLVFLASSIFNAWIFSLSLNPLSFSLNHRHFRAKVMASRDQDTAAIQEESTRDEAAHETPKEHTSCSSYLGLLPANPSKENGSDTLHQVDGQDSQSILYGRRLFPIVYTKSHFEDLGLSADQYTKAMLKRHQEQGIIITRRDIERHWRRQVRREYDRSHPLWTSLQNQVPLLFLQ